MFYLIMAILCSCSISIIMRISSKYVPNSYGMLCMNYLVCFLVGLCHILPIELSDFKMNDTLFFGVIQGLFYLASFVLFQRNVQKKGMILSSLFMKLGVIIPLLLSIVLFKEFPTSLQWIGIIMAFIALFMINYDKNATKQAIHFSLFLLLIINGGGDAMSKIFENYGDLSKSSFFLIYTFLFAFIICFAMCMLKKEKINFKTVLFGTLIGIPNYYSSYFLLDALQHLPGIIVYPCFSIATILIITTVGCVVFKERFTLQQKLACALIVLSLCLLNF